MKGLGKENSKPIYGCFNIPTYIYSGAETDQGLKHERDVTPHS